MKLHLVAAACVSMFLGFATQSLSQSNADHAPGAVTQPDPGKTFTHGESKRCESMSGADKDQCDKEEATKTQGPAAQEASKPQDSSTGASTSKPQDSSRGASKY